MVKKHVKKASHNLKYVLTTYEGKHNHEVPIARTNNQVSVVVIANPRINGHGLLPSLDFKCKYLILCACTISCCVCSFHIDCY